MALPVRQRADRDTYVREPEVQLHRVLLLGQNLAQSASLFSTKDGDPQLCASTAEAAALAELPELLVIDASVGMEEIVDFVGTLEADSPRSFIVVADPAADPRIAADQCRAAFHIGADDFLQRPLTVDVVGETLERCFDTLWARRRSAARQKELRTVEQHFHQLAGNIPQISWIADKPMGKTLYISPAYETIFGLSREEMISNTYSFYELIHPDDLERVDTRWEGRPWTDYGPHEWNEVTYRIIRKDGSIRWLWTRAFVIRDEAGEPYRLCGISEDITERKLLEEELVHTQKMTAIGELAGGIAHDFNNLLTPILGYSNLLREGRLTSERIPRIAEVIEKASLRAMDLTGRLLGFARRGKHQDLSIDIHNTLAEIDTLIGRTFDKGIVVERELYAPEPYVLGDPHQLHQVFLNLAINARDAMEGVDKPLLGFRTEIAQVTGFGDFRTPGLEPGRYLMISVSDNGVGIDEEVQRQIFEPFFTTKARGQGSGMGLAMVYGIVKNHGGSVIVDSSLGAGSTFHVYLPLTEKKPAEVSATAVDQPVAGKGHVLLVDDEDTVLEVAADMLQALGYSVATARNGKEAVAYYRSHWREVDLVILDMLMPEMGGRDAFVELQQISPDVQAVLSTGYDLNHAAQEILNQGVRGFFQKPYTIEQFSRAIAEVMERPGEQENTTK